MKPADYLAAINQLLATGQAREHAYRGDLQSLLKSILPKDYDVINEPSQIRGVGNPDFLVRNADGVAIGYLEAKDIGKDLDHKDYHEQFDRYRKGLDNLIITDYLRFDFYQTGQLVHTVRIGELNGQVAVPTGSNYDTFTNLLRDFGQYVGEPIRSPKRLAELMAGKARLLQDILRRAVEVDIEADNDNELRQQFNTFRDVLIHDLNPQQFSDLYAQTLAYGLFAARLHDETMENFSRQEAGELIPKSNPFLRRLFNFVAGNDIDLRIKATVDNLADIFLHADVRALMTDYGRSTQQTDAVVHFYETFLAEYDPALRKARGVWYTPQPVVDFIVRAVDDILKTEFGLKDGLADNSKIKVKRKVMTKATADRRSKMKEVEVEEEVHRVQILDPATGTGTFLAAVIQYVYDKNFQMMPGAWPDYVEQHLIPRLNGFELLMASYAMAHLKLDLQLRGTGYTRELGQRFKVYLTNSLEEEHPDAGTLFASFLSNEANEANAIKRDTPVMCVIGNPPYSGERANKGEWIMGLMKDYKKEADGSDLKERNTKWINNDYIKFLRLGQHLIDKNKCGLLVFICPNTYLDSRTLRGVRNSMLKSYSTVRIVDLHGSVKKSKLLGSSDENVFDIGEGVSINILVKNKSSGELGDVYYHSVKGSRNSKYSFLNSSSLDTINWEKVEQYDDMSYFVPTSSIDAGYSKGFQLPELFEINGMGITTAHDAFVMGDSRSEIITRFEKFTSHDPDENKLHSSFDVKKKKGWSIINAQSLLKNIKSFDSKIQLFDYRVFDTRYILYDDSVVWRTVEKVFSHSVQKENYNLCACKANRDDSHTYFIGKNIINKSIITSLDNSYAFPLYLYPTGDELSFDAAVRRPNLDEKIVAKLAEGLGLRFTPEKESDATTFAPIDLLDYIYAVLHDPLYRETYAEFLKIDFPRVPYPTDVARFWALVQLGGELRRLHLLEHPLVDEPLASYHGAGDNTVSRKLSKTSPGFELTDEAAATGRVWINDGQYFDGVPEAAWNFYIGGYQPAQKWLKDRRDRQLSYDDIRHYLRIIRTLTETERIMDEISRLSLTTEA